jgi:hypothetical protein
LSIHFDLLFISKSKKDNNGWIPTKVQVEKRIRVPGWV